jgi:hypothetical protein
MYFITEKDGKRLTVYRDTRGGAARDSETYICKIYDSDRAVPESVICCPAIGGITELLSDMSKSCAPEYAPLFEKLLTEVTPDTSEKTAVRQNVRYEYKVHKDAELLKSKDGVYGDSFKNNFYISMYEFFMDEELIQADYEALEKEGEDLLDGLWDKYLSWDGILVETTDGILEFVSEYIEYAIPNTGDGTAKGDNTGM